MVVDRTIGGAPVTWLVLVTLVIAGCSGDGNGGGDAGKEGSASVTWTAGDIEQNNRGVALMGYFDYPAARAVFEQLVEQKPRLADAGINLAIATLNRQEAGDEVLAMQIVDAVLANAPDDVRALYVKGLLLLNVGQPAQAGDYFRRVSEARPDDAYAAYFTGQTLAKTDALEAAVASYRRAIDNDPYLRSAYYGAAQTLRRLGRTDDARAMLDAYQRFEGNPRARLAEFKYTRMGPLADAWTVGNAAPRRERPQGDLFAAPQSLAAPVAGGPQASLTTVDINGDGIADLFVAAGPASAAPNAVLIAQEDGAFVTDVDHPLARVDGVRAALWGDVDNDGHVDVYLCRNGENALWMQTAPGVWSDVTSASGTGGGPLDSIDGAMVDADHDGDLDVYVVNADGANELFNNNLDGSFRPLAEAHGVGGDGRVSTAVLAADLDRDRDADLVVIGEVGNAVYQNDRLWSYRPAPGFDAFAAAPVVAAVAGDVDTDGQVDIYAVDDGGVVSRWSPAVDGAWAGAAVGVTLSVAGARPQLGLFDIDGDGRLDLLTIDDIAVSVWDLEPGKPAALRYRHDGRVTSAIPLLRHPPAGPSLAGLAGTGADRLTLWPPGPGRFAFTAISVTGKEDSADSMRSNRSGIGTRLSLRLGDEWTVATTFDNHSGPGASLGPVALGLGGRERADYVAIDWSDGVFQTELDLAGGVVHRIAETQRQLSSCPVVFAWDGRQYGFVSDVLGVGGLGFLVEPGRYAEPRPWERFLMPRGAMAPRDGRYALKITEPMEEIAYLDSARLHVYDVPAGWSMVLDERMATGAPAVTGRPIYYRDTVRPVRAYNERGHDVTDRIALVDNEAAPPGRLDSRFIGRLAGRHMLTVEFDGPLDASARPVLVAHGWVEYPYSQTVFAAWQAGAGYDAPSLEARVRGRWVSVYPGFGYPAGMPRAMALPLERLPAGADALRLITNLEVYWDSVAVVYEQAAPRVEHHVLSPVVAAQAQPGFPERIDRPQSRPDYDYANRSPVWDTRYLAGWYSPLGDVMPLVQTTDDAVAVIGPGEEVHLEFDAPEARDGLTRHIVLDVRGWAKDMDLYTRDGGTVEPMPARDDRASATELHQRWLTRYQAGR